MTSFLLQIGRNRLHWVIVIALALATVGIALYYEHALNRFPCSLCIHARLWVLAIAVAGIVGLLAGQSRSGRSLAGLLSLGAAIGLLERSLRLLGTERSWFLGSCKNHAGLPDWFALDDWFPALFGVKSACGRTPELLFGVTMAEGLVALAVLATAFGAAVLIGGVARR